MKLEIQAQEEIEIDVSSCGICMVFQKTGREIKSCIFIAPDNVDLFCRMLKLAKVEAQKIRNGVDNE